MIKPMQFPGYAGRTIFNEDKRYLVYKGGRGSAKSYSVAQRLISKALSMENRLIFCAREHQNSIKQSVHELIKRRIYSHGYEDYFTIKDHYIQHKTNGSKFIYAGLWQNEQGVKSTEGITDAWIEEAQKVSVSSLNSLIPTVRMPKSQIFITYNPLEEDGPIHSMFCGPDGPPPNSTVVTANWRDNPWFPEILNEERLLLRSKDDDLYRHVWEGECRQHSDAQIFKGKFKIENFIPRKEWEGPFQGIDWGFSVDPFAFVQVYIDFKAMRLYVWREAGGIRIDIDNIPRHLEPIDGAFKRPIMADPSRPETISHLKKRKEVRGIIRPGLMIHAAETWKGSVEDGIDWLKNFEIIIHPSCDQTADEFRKYSYKIDRLTEMVTRDIVDAFNHYIDAIRYACDKLIRSKKSILEFV